MNEHPYAREASRSLADVIGPLSDEQAARVLAIFNRYPQVPQSQPTVTPDAA